VSLDPVYLASKQQHLVGQRIEVHENGEHRLREGDGAGVSWAREPVPERMPALGLGNAILDFVLKRLGHTDIIPHMIPTVKG